jgi:hypothetical protein
MKVLNQMYSYKFKESLEQFESSVNEDILKFFKSCGISKSGLSKIYISSLYALFFNESTPSLKPNSQNLLLKFSLILVCFIIQSTLSIATFICQTFIEKNGNTFEEKFITKCILWADYSPSSFKPFKYLHSRLPENTIVFAVSFKTLAKIRHVEGYSFFYIHCNFNTIVKSMFFLTLYLPKLIRITGTDYKLSSLINFSIEYIKAIMASEKAKIILNKNPFLTSKISLFPHEVSPYYSSMIDIFNQNNIPTVTLIHGGFSFSNNIHYFPTKSKYVLTPSNREKELYSHSHPERSHSIGIPMQQFVDKQLFIAKRKSKYQFLIIGGYGSYWENLIQLEPLKALSKLDGNFKTLLRHHPSGIKSSQHFIESYLKNSNYSLSSGTTLEEDISSSEIIISFSVDSNITCLLNRKQTVYCAFPDANIPSRLLKWENLLYIVSSEAEMLETLNKLIVKPYQPAQDIPPNFYKEFVREFGEFDEHKILKNIKAAINEIQLLESV